MVTVTDRLTKMVHLIPTVTTASAPDLAKLFITHIFRLHGMPAVLVSDRDSRFTSKFWQALMTQLGTKLAMSTAHHPQTDGQSERTNRTLEEALRSYVNYSMDNWVDQLPLLEFAINNSKQASTGQSPFFLNYGHNPLTPHAFLNQARSNPPTYRRLRILSPICSTYLLLHAIAYSKLRHGRPPPLTITVGTFLTMLVIRSF